MKSAFLQKLDDDFVLCAEGYVFELERRGYISAGAFVPEVVIDNPEALGRTVVASKYSSDISKHAVLGDVENVAFKDNF
jgi:hypothetical protein